MTPTTIDPDKLKFFSFHVFTKLEGAITSGMIYIGHELGLYRHLRDAHQELSAGELAAAAGLDERWVLEWARNQAAAKIIDSADGSTFSLSAEAAMVLADPDGPAYGMGMFMRLPSTMASLDRLPESFRTGLGYDYDAHGETGAAGIEVNFAPWFRHQLVSVGLPALDGVVERLHAGAKVADVGCGAGVAVLTMATAFPKSAFWGFDISHHALERAKSKQVDAGITNAVFNDPREQGLPTDNSLDLVTTFDCLHDMTHPQEIMKSIRQSLKPDGVWFVADIKARDTFAENVQKNPMASMMYGISVMSCMASALSEHGGAGLGTLGLSESRLTEMAGLAGFSTVKRLPIDHAVNAFYQITV